VKDWNRMRRFVEAVELSVTRMPDATGRSL
jgi:hypothetical protein